MAISSTSRGFGDGQSSNLQKESTAQRGQMQNGRSEQFGKNGHNGQRRDERLTKFLGWFSISLGLARTFAPRAVSRMAGISDSKSMGRLHGLRELASGVGILTQPKPTGWVWGRVGGDALDLAALAQALGSDGGERGKTIGAMAAVAGVTALDVMCARSLTARDAATPEAADRSEASIVVGKSPEECYAFWRDFEKHPQFELYLKSVRITSDKTTHWVAAIPGTGARVEWDAELMEDIPNKRIAWQSLPGSDVYHSGSVDFSPAPGGRGTMIRAQVLHSQPGQSIGSLLAKMVGKHPEDIVYKDLRRFKQVMETGEAITTDGQPAGRRGSTTWLDAVAR